jgi:hypothetical protein
MRWLSGLLIVILAPMTARAHDLGVSYEIKDDTVLISAFYDDDAAAAGAVVMVLDAGSRTIARGKTDDKGAWSFPLPPAGVYRIDVDAGAGHHRRIRLPVANGNANDGMSREEFTRSRWPELTIGLAIIGAAAVGLRWFLRSRQCAAPSAKPHAPSV